MTLSRKCLLQPPAGCRGSNLCALPFRGCLAVACLLSRLPRNRVSSPPLPTMSRSRHCCAMLYLALAFSWTCSAPPRFFFERHAPWNSILPEKCPTAPMLNVRAFPLHGMWLLRSASSPKICCFLSFVNFPFSFILYLSVGLTFVCMKIGFICVCSWLCFISFTREHTRNWTY